MYGMLSTLLGSWLVPVVCSGDGYYFWLCARLTWFSAILTLIKPLVIPAQGPLSEPDFLRSQVFLSSLSMCPYLSSAFSPLSALPGCPAPSRGPLVYWCFLLWHSTKEQLQCYMKFLMFKVLSSYWLWHCANSYRKIWWSAHHLPGIGSGINAHNDPGRSVKILSLVSYEQTEARRGEGTATQSVRHGGWLNSGWLPVKSSFYCPPGARAIHCCVFSELVTHIVGLS